MKKISVSDFNDVKIKELEELVNQGQIEKHLFPTYELYIIEKNEYSFKVAVKYNEEVFKKLTLDEIEANFKDSYCHIYRNGKEIEFSSDNLKKSIGRLAPKDLEIFEVEGNSQFLQKCYKLIGKLGYERTLMLDRFLLRLINEYPVLERVHKAGFDLNQECFRCIQNYKTNSLVEAFGFQNKTQLKMYRMSLNGEFGRNQIWYDQAGEGNPIVFTPYYIQSLSEQELNFFFEMKNLVEDLDNKYGLKKKNEIFQAMNTYRGFNDSSIGSFLNKMKSYGLNLNYKRLIEYLAYELDVRQGMTNLRNSMNIYADYIKFSKALGTKFERYPKSLMLRHDIAYKYYDIISKSENITENFKKSSEKIKYLEGKIDDDYAIVIPESPEDLIKEGEELSHCVKSYIQTVSTGDVQIGFLRKADDLETPLYTLEFRKNALVQFAGYCNCRPDDKAKAAIDKLAKDFNLILEYE